MRNTIRNKRIFRRVKNNKAKILILFCVLFCTTALFIGFFVGTSSVLDSVERFNEDNNAESGMIISDKEDIDELETEKIKYVDYKLGDKTVRVFQERESINKYQVTSGNDLNYDKDILIDNNFITENNLSIGDSIKVTNNDFKIVGTAISPDYITTKNSEQVLQANAKDFGIAFVKKETFDKFFANEYIQTYYAYKSDKDLVDVSTITESKYIKDSANNSRMKQVIGDAKAPKQLSIIVVAVFYSICTVLNLVYHHGMFKKEKNNILTLYSLGEEKNDMFFHYSLESNILIVIAWILGSVIGCLSIEIVMQMNSKIYNYPSLIVDKKLLFIVVGIALILPIIINNIIVYIYYLKNNVYKKNMKSSRLQNKISKSSLNYIYKYRLIKMLRNKQEILMFTLLIFIVGFLINFSFLLKASVEQYVRDLDKENKFKYIFFIGADEYNLKKAEEKLLIYNLYDESNTSQNVNVVDKATEFYDMPIDSGVVVTEAFHKKYKVGKNDDITLRDIQNNITYKLKIDAVNDIKTVSEVYMTNDLKEKIFDENTYYTEAIVTLHNDLLEENNYSKVSKEEVITSGKNIVKVINSQITLIIIISIIIEAFLMYSLFELIISNNSKSIKILKLNGFSNKEVIKIHFLFNNIIAVSSIIASYFLGRVSVRVFLDQIMFTFINFVDVVNDIKVIMITNLVIISLYLGVYYYSRRIISKI